MRTIASTVFLSMLLIMAGCDLFDARDQSPSTSIPPAAVAPTAAVAHVVADTAHMLLWGSVIAGVVLTLGDLASFIPFAAFLSPFRSLMFEGSILCYAAVLVSTCLLYLAEYPWLLNVSIGTVVIALVWRYRAKLETLLGKYVPGLGIVPPAVPAPPVTAAPALTAKQQTIVDNLRQQIAAGKAALATQNAHTPPSPPPVSGSTP